MQALNAVSDLATIGDNCVDRYLPPVDECLVGGNAVNVAVQLALLGRAVSYFGAIGADAAGDAVRAAMAVAGVGLDHLQVLPGELTAHTDIATAPEGERRFVFEDFGASAAYRPGSDDVAALRRKRHVHVGWLRDTSRLKRSLAGSGMSLSQDLTVNNQPEDLMPEGLDIAFRSAVPAEAEREARHLLSGGARLAVITMAAAGSLASDGTRWARVGAPAIVPVDTTGAGDAFIAGFIDARLAGSSLADCLTHGTARAGIACLHRGGFPQRPMLVGCAARR